MHITFGWEYDHARWTDRSTPASSGTVVVGPQRLANLLATRLACSAPSPDPAARTATVRQALGTVLADYPTGHPFTLSFRADPWQLAREVLRWRDELVTAGWDGISGAGISPRIDLIRNCEQLVTADVDWTPGPADLLRTVDLTLTSLATAGTRWPLGIDSLTVDHATTALPPVWQRILGNLTALGVPVTGTPAPATAADLRTVTTDSEWDAAAVAVRLLTADPAGVLSDGPVTVLASRPTDLLDAELQRRGLPALRVGDMSGERGFAQIVPVFLAAVTSPPDVHAIAELLGHTVTTTGTPDGRRPVCLVPARDRYRVLRALSREPGVGGPAWRDALDQVDPESPMAALDAMVRTDPLVEAPDGSGLDTATVARHLTWLADRLTALATGARAAADTAADAVVLDATADAVRTVVRTVTRISADSPGRTTGATSRISTRELRGIITDCLAPAATAVSRPADADPRIDTVTRPGRLGREQPDVPILWWIPVDDGTDRSPTFRPAEVTGLERHGVLLPDAEDLATLGLDSELRALRGRGHITAVLPGVIDGEPAAGHPALTFLAHDHPTPPDPLRPADLLPDTVHTPAPADPRRPDPVHRTVTAGSHLLPDRLSYSQWTTLLAHPLEWLLDRQLGVRAGGATEIPTGNRMTGTFLHAVVQDMVDRRGAGAPDPVTVVPEPGEIRADLDRLMPLYASELLLPGHSRQRGIVTDTAETAITGLFAMLGSAGIRVTGAETGYTTTVPGTCGRDGREIVLVGYRDLDVVLPDGRPGVIDLKYTGAKKKYRELVEEGAAFQLAVYAFSVASPGSTLDRVPVGYYSLKQARMDTSFADFRSPTLLRVRPGPHGSTDPSALWSRAVNGLNRILTDLRNGTITDVGNLLEQPGWVSLSTGLDKLTRAARRGTLSPDDLIDASPWSPDQVRELQEAVHTAVRQDFLPLDITRYTGYGLITGLNGDYL